MNPFVDHLRTLFSQSTDSNAGTRSGAAAAPFDLYVATRLDERLTRDVLAGPVPPGNHHRERRGRQDRFPRPAHDRRRS